MATVVVVGAGIGGLTAATTLRKGLAREHEVAVVEREMVQGFYPSLLWILEGRRTPKDITRSLDALSRRGITLIHDTVQDIDMAHRVVKCEREQVPYDFLVLAPGADHAPELVPGLVDGPTHPMASGSARTSGPVFNLFSIEGILGLRGALEAAERGDILVVAPTGPHKCPPVPVETAMILDRVLRRAGKRKRFSIRVFSPETLPFEAAGAAVGRTAVQAMARRGVSYHGNWHLEAVERDRRVAVFAEGRVAYDILVFIPPIRVPDFVRRAGLSSGNDGFVSVDPHYLSVSGPAAPDSAGGKDRVFAIGDVTSIPMPRGGFVPKSGAIAHLQSLVVVGNISALVRGKSPARRFSGTAMCVIEMGDLAPITAVGNFLARSGDFKVLPRLRTFVSIKAAIERKWLSERE
ncbi:MAG TPA: NAD(P)/FAD-dependent oxidoreductase [Firmicutes bacterium]|nr:NAD(P)/FAD-dependent oxidoreductase [Bacillota bacterium]